jgi:hypothetical protein
MDGLRGTGGRVPLRSAAFWPLIGFKEANGMAAGHRRAALADVTLVRKVLAQRTRHMRAAHWIH